MKQIINPAENKIAQEFFIRYTNGTTVKKKLFPDSTSKKLGAIGRPFNKWKKLGYITESNLFYIKKHKKGKNKEIEYPQSGPKYIINMNILFDYLKENGVDNLTLTEKNYLNFIFSSTHIRKAVCEIFPDEELREAILKFYLKFFILPVSLNQDYIKNSKEINKNKLFFDKLEEYFSKHSKNKKEFLRIMKNPIKLTKDKKIDKLCEENLKIEFDENLIKPIDYTKLLCRSSYLSHYENPSNRKFIIHLNKKILIGLGVDTI